MSQTDDHSDDAALAAEYVLHLLDDEERANFERRLAVEPVLRGLVRDWEEQLVILADDIAPVAPPQAVKDRLQQTLFPEPTKRARPIWGWVSGGVLAAAIAVGAAVFLPPLLQQPTFAPTLTASVAAEDGTLLITASFIAEESALEIVREVGAARPGRVLELWLIAEGADAPVSLGVLPEASEARLELPSDLVRQLPNGLLAISDEPPGGSPTGAPTGDVLAAGQIASI